MLAYKGYTGRFGFDSEAKIFRGEVVGTRDVITFQGETAAELEQAFHDSVDDYLAFCKARGEAPEKPGSGPALHNMSASILPPPAAGPAR